MKINIWQAWKAGDYRISQLYVMPLQHQSIHVVGSKEQWEVIMHLSLLWYGLISRSICSGQCIGEDRRWLFNLASQLDCFEKWWRVSNSEGINRSDRRSSDNSDKPSGDLQILRALCPREPDARKSAIWWDVWTMANRRPYKSFSPHINHHPPQSTLQSLTDIRPPPWTTRRSIHSWGH